jgi:protein SCO1/2
MPPVARAETYVAPPAEHPVERLDKVPDELEGVGIDERLGGQVPLNLDFTDSDGVHRALAEILDARRPAILTLNYSNCPMLCSLQLDGFVDGLKELAWTPGDQFTILTVSIDPNETQEHSKLYKEKYMAQLQRPEAAKGWYFLRGSQEKVEQLARTVGFKYRYVPERKEYAHTAAVMVLSPEGMVTRYLYGVRYEARDLKLALVEAAEGKVGSTLDRILLYCFHYDSATGKYTAVAENIMRLTGALTLVILVAAIGGMYLRDAKRQKPAE